ncbi:MAG: EAL domain-containing protein [Gammaproteobacteria bacterium]|nr:EAL domain-containing protein [Gammaproteobacteria bacterium]
MGGHSILYIGRDDFATDFIERLRGDDACSHLLQCESVQAFAGDTVIIDLVVFEAEAGINQSTLSPHSVIQSLGSYPLIALTHRDQEHRGIAAVHAGAQDYLCIDDISSAELASSFDHAIQRHTLLGQLSNSDTTVLSILGSINDGVIIVDREGHVLDINPAGRSILGIPARQRPENGWEERFCVTASDGKTAIEKDEQPLVKARRGEKFSNQLAVFHTDNQTDITLSINGQGLFDSNRELVGGLITFRDVTDIIRRTVELEQRAQYDDLTHLPNRRLFIHQLEKAIGRAQRSKKPLAVLFVDLDKFKSVNDTLGHDVGDELLRQVASRMTRNLRIGDFCGRWGGDEFVVCLEDFDKAANAAAAAQKLVLVLSEKYHVGTSEVYATPSIGIAIYPESGELAGRLIKAADLAMYQAKKRGGGRFQYYSSVLNNKLAQREELELGLRHALVRNEFVLHYQPRIDVNDGRLIGLEALLRWQHPRFGLLPPGRFLGILESSGLIHSAGEWIIDTACRQLAAWQRQFEMPDLGLAINLSPQQLLHGRLLEAISRSLADTMLDPGCIEFEIGDGDIVRERTSVNEILQGLRKLGVRLSLDHFGTRDVSFNALDTDVIDSFVLDQSLIQDVEINGSHQRIVRAAIAMARGLDIEVAAEGVETISQLEFLRSCNCDLAQGFLISRPVQAEKVSAILRSEIAGTRLLSRSMA